MSGESENLTPAAYAEAIEKARKDGFTVIQDDDYHLLIDIDNESSEKVFLANFQILVDNAPFPLQVIGKWFSRSGRGIHIVIALGKPLALETRLLFQASLGSDPKRELLSLLASWNGVDKPSLLFRPDPVTGKVTLL